MVRIKRFWSHEHSRDPISRHADVLALVKEFNAAFGNKDGRKRIRAEYEKAESTYINEILDVEDHVHNQVVCVPVSVFVER